MGIYGIYEQSLRDRERAEEKFEASRPVCDCCGEPIVGEYTFVIDGEYYCEDCAEEWLRKVRVDTEVLCDD